MGEAERPRRRWPRNLTWAVVLLVWLVNPALSLSDMDNPAPAAIGLAAFTVGYLALIRSCWQAPAPESGLTSPAQLAGLILLTALGIALAAAYGAGSGGWRIVLLYVTAAGVIILTGPRMRIAWLAGTVATQVVIGAVQRAPIDDLSWMAFSTLLVGGLVLAFLRMEGLIAHLRRTQAELAEAAVASERLRFARDLHDLLGHTLSLIVVKAEVARHSAERDPATTARETGEIEHIGRRALAEVREAVTGYRERPFAAELDAARSALADAGVAVNVRANGTPLPHPADTLLGWAVREAATNVVRHSQARHCEIEVDRTEDRASLHVRDDGVGAATSSAKAGHGLEGLAERLAAAGGSLDTGADPDGGWRLTATVPVSLSHASGS